MATSSIYAAFTIRDNPKAAAFAEACEWSKAHPRPKRKHQAEVVKDEELLDALFAKLNKIYGCPSK